MKTTNHTPGTWAVSPYMNITSRNGTVAKTEQMPGNDDSEREANAHLIAAAPDLLDILRDLLDWGRVHISPAHDTAAHLLLVRAFEAIAKAEGVA